jgi:hypothetical protein
MTVISNSQEQTIILSQMAKHILKLDIIDGGMLLHRMKQRTLKNLSNCLNTNIYSYLETSGGKSYNLYLNVVHFFNNSATLTSVAA